MTERDEAQPLRAAKAVRIQPATERDEAQPLRAAKAVRIQPATERDEAQPLHVATAAIRGTAEVAVGPSQPRFDERTGDAVGALSLILGGAGFGFEVGHAVGGLPGGFVGGAAGGALSVTTLRWQPARKAAFRFIRSLTDE